MQNFRTLGQPILGKSNQIGEKERKRKNTVNSGHYILPETPKGSERTMLRPIVAFARVGVLLPVCSTPSNNEDHPSMTCQNVLSYYVVKKMKIDNRFTLKST